MIGTIIVPFLFKIVGAILLWVVGGWLIGFAMRVLRRSFSMAKLDPTLIGFLLSLISALLRLGAIHVACRLQEPDSLPTPLVMRNLWGSWSSRILRIPRVEIVPITQPDGGIADEAISNSLEVVSPTTTIQPATADATSTKPLPPQRRAA